MAATGRACGGEGGAQSAGARRAPPRVRHRCLNTREGCLSVSPTTARSVSGHHRLPASPCPRLCPPAEAWRPPPGQPTACADDGRQAIIVGRIRRCVAETYLAGSSDGVLAANRGCGRATRQRRGRGCRSRGDHPPASPTALSRSPLNAPPYARSLSTMRCRQSTTGPHATVLASTDCTTERPARTQPSMPST
jgi:hypothetical protein